MRKDAIIMIVAGTLCAAPAFAADVPVAGRKLVVTDKLTVASRAKVVFVALDAAVTKGAGTDPAAIQATFDVAYAGTSVAGAFVLPAGASNGSDGWKVNKSTVAKYVNKLAPGGGPTDAKVGVIKPAKALKIVGKSLGDTPFGVFAAGAPPAGGVDTVFTVANGPDTTRHCTNFPQASCSYKLIAAGTGAKLVCRNGSGSACPGPSTTTSTTIGTTTSVSSTLATTTTFSTSTSSSSTTSSSTSTSSSTTSSSTTSTTSSTSTSTSTTLCANQLFTFTVNSSAGGLFSSAQWPGGTATQQQSPGCTVTINQPDDNIDLVCTLAAPFSVNGFTGFSNCFGIGGEDGDGCNPVSCPPLGIGSCCFGRPSCSAALNGSGSAQYFVQCLQ